MTDDSNRDLSGAVNQSPGMNEREGEILQTMIDHFKSVIVDGRGVPFEKTGVGLPTAALAGYAYAPSAWQPIETAPKDGTEILVTREGNGLLTRIVKWAPEPSEDYDAEPTDLTWRIVDRPMACMRNSTHWMPVPSLPSSDRGGVG